MCVLVLLKSFNCVYLCLKFNIDNAINECIKQTAHLFKLNAKIICLFKTFKQNESQILVKVHCIAEKLDDNTNKVTNNEKTSENIITFNFLIKLMSSSFFTDSKPSS